MNTLIFENYLAFLNRPDADTNGVSPQFAADNPDYEKQNETNKSCWGCSDCSRCSDCSDLKNARPVEAPEPSTSWFDVPVIPNLHQTVLAAVERPGALDMRNWHTCETTHCRAGWIVQLAGEKGRKLELASSCLFAAMQIAKASSPIGISPVRFFETNEVALADMKRCAELEAKA